MSHIWFYEGLPNQEYLVGTIVSLDLYWGPTVYGEPHIWVL